MRKLVGFVLFSIISFLVSLILQQLSTPHIIHPHLHFTSPKGGSHKSSTKDCLSRYESALYRKESPYKPSSYLITKLRKYEKLHKRCGPYTESYNRTVRNLDPDNHDRETSDQACKYLVQIPFDGLGNRILSLASAFLYALLTDRVLLVYDKEGETADLFCEPFPETTWILPQDFPIRNRLENMSQESPECYGNMLMNHSGINSSFVYLHLIYTFDDYDKLFFCDQDQNFIQNVSWVIMKSQFYFAPSLFLIKSFEQELASLFPEKETVFHFLGRYLFHPSNPVWELITRYHRTYLAKSDEKIGIQIRTFHPRFLAAAFNFTTSSLEPVPDTILACLFNNNLLPEININESQTGQKNENSKSVKSVIVTSLTSKYYEKLRDVFWEHSTVTGDEVGVFQPSSEGDQKTGDKKHDRKAWAEIYLLSLTDKLITSPWSTFGYVAQGLGGLRPWILHMPKDEMVPDPPCTRAVSMEPCFHKPVVNGCKMRTAVDDTGALDRYVRACEDASQGLKLVDPKAI
ncbi:hypothetical protein SSX86_000185 [Deinandra increscens subsp. villosa]|uniref:Fucosyltransferase n=1 Tax=Deinandra increscens subsp. villosa TaxID=3103831 RepID=A0AAP0HDA8_9ASTR